MIQLSNCENQCIRAQLDTYESTAVIVSHCLRIAECFQKRIGFQNHVFYFLYLLASTAHPRYIRHYIFRRNSFSSARFTTVRLILKRNKYIFDKYIKQKFPNISI